MFRCLDHAGASTYDKARLVELSRLVVSTIDTCGLRNRSVAFRIPLPDLATFEQKEKKILPDLSPPQARVTNWEVSRDFLPEISKSVILRFLRSVNPVVDENSRVWYRAMQRVMDMGNLRRLWATRPEGGVMWLGFR